MQLDAVLRSLQRHSSDRNAMDVQVLYTVSDMTHERQYGMLAAAYPDVKFVREHDFKSQLLSVIGAYPFTLFLVDDNLFVRPFSIGEMADALQQHPDTLGYSLRLGRNTRYCYSMNMAQALPPFQVIGGVHLKFDWTVSQCEFGYPLEISSSLYRTGDLFRFLAASPFANPNTLELQLATHAALFAAKRYLFCRDASVTFCNPVNKVQQLFPNRSGTRADYSALALSRLFDEGYRIDVAQYDGFTPNACHQEVGLIFRT
jgi:hypothetical protein